LHIVKGYTIQILTTQEAEQVLLVVRNEEFLPDVPCYSMYGGVRAVKILL
jgi:hypothetical protein